jgi:heme-degrading monooxygenase HmoA
MFLRFTYLQFAPENVAKAKSVYMNEIAPAIRTQKGNKEVTFLETADGSNEFISSSLWETEADIREFETSTHYPEIIERIKTFVSKPPVQKYYHVANT